MIAGRLRPFLGSIAFLLRIRCRFMALPMNWHAKNPNAIDKTSLPGAEEREQVGIGSSSPIKLRPSTPLLAQRSEPMALPASLGQVSCSPTCASRPAPLPPCALGQPTEAPELAQALGPLPLIRFPLLSLSSFQIARIWA